MQTLFKTKQPFVAFVTGGDGGVDYCVEACLQLIAGGVDILEIGFPFSDPVADGPVIQRSSQRALSSNTNADTMLEVAKRIRQISKTPLVLFSYFNTLLQSGDDFLDRAKSAGYDAVLIVDLPPVFTDGTTHPYFQKIKNANLIPIFVVAQSTDDERLKQIATMADGFIYYACQKGTTGVKSSLPDNMTRNIERIKQLTSVPVVVGFGIGDALSVKKVLEHADGFVVGSAIVKLMENQSDPAELKKLAKSLVS